MDGLILPYNIMECAKNEFLCVKKSVVACQNVTHYKKNTKNRAKIGLETKLARQLLIYNCSSKEHKNKNQKTKGVKDYVENDWYIALGSVA